MATEERSLSIMSDGAESLAMMSGRLAEMTQRLNLVKQFFQQVMVKDQDYGVIPGTDKPTLLKSGAEKLCEFYGYAIQIKDQREECDRETGYYRVVITIALISKRTGELIAEGVGEASTYENRYRYRWLPEWKVPKGVDTSGLLSETRTSKKGEFKAYRFENDDLHSLWNTVLKMAKKRAHIDATLSATRSSGIFTQDVEDLKEWVDTVDADGVTVDGVGQQGHGTSSRQQDNGRNQARQQQQNNTAGISQDDFNKLCERAKALGINGDEFKHLWKTTIDGKRLPAWTAEDRAAMEQAVTELGNAKKEAAAGDGPDDVPFGSAEQQSLM